MDGKKKHPNETSHYPMNFPFISHSFGPEVGAFEFPLDWTMASSWAGDQLQAAGSDSPFKWRAMELLVEFPKHHQTSIY